ncbi:MAG: class I SAM-dependent methyltransferase [Acidimicrobiia bacterium]
MRSFLKSLLRPFVRVLRRLWQPTTDAVAVGIDQTRELGVMVERAIMAAESGSVSRDELMNQLNMIWLEVNHLVRGPGNNQEATSQRSQINSRLNELEVLIKRHGETHAELSAYTGHRLRDVADHSLLARQSLEDLRAELDRLRSDMDPARVTKISDLSQSQAAFLNYADGPWGFKAQAGVWFNWPFNIEHQIGGAVIREVNERIVELPFVYASMIGLKPGAHVLDLGCTESPVAFSLACLGYNVVAIDLRNYPLSHPRLTTVMNSFETWDPPQTPFDAVISLSSIEHFGLGAYGGLESRENEADRKDADRKAMAKLHAITADDGLLVLTAPFGVYGVDELQRTYDLDHLMALLEGWAIEEASLARRASSSQWEVIGGLDRSDDMMQEGARGVAMVRARRRPR